MLHVLTAILARALVRMKTVKYRGPLVQYEICSLFRGNIRLISDELVCLCVCVLLGSYGLAS